MQRDAEIKSYWETSEIGQCCEAKAVSATGRVLGIVRVDIPVLDGFEISTIYGREVTREAVEQAARNVAGQFLKEADADVGKTR